MGSSVGSRLLSYPSRADARALGGCFCHQWAELVRVRSGFDRYKLDDVGVQLAKRHLTPPGGSHKWGFHGDVWPPSRGRQAKASSRERQMVE